MSAPYVSIKRLTENSMSAMLSAVEIYNKPRVTYRDEVTVILIVNAWELALKAALRQKNRTVFYPKRRGQRYRSLSVDDCLGRISANGLWPSSIDGLAVEANLKALTEYRDRAIHLYNAPGLAAMIQPFLQQNILNYRDFVFEKFNRDLADSMTWQLLPLGATAPAEAVRFMRPNSTKRAAEEVQDFIDDLRALVDKAEQGGSDMTRVATAYDVHLQSIKSLTGADLHVAVSPDSDGKVLFKKSDPNQTHPFTMRELLDKVNERRTGRTLTSYDYAALCWKEDLKANPRHAWKHSNANSHVWSGDAITYLAAKDDAEYDAIRSEYGARSQSDAEK